MHRMKNDCKNSKPKISMEEPTGKSRHKWKNTIKINLKETQSEDMDWI
jgi:hypothetical protein